MTPPARVGALLLAMSLAGCVTPDPQHGLPAFAGAEGPTGLVAATRQDITSVVTLDATVSASPAYTVNSPEAGVVTYTGRLTGLVATIRRDGTTHEVVLPASTGLVRRLAEPGATVPAGLPVAEARYTGFALSAAVPVTALYRFYGTLGPVKGQIERGPGPFDCPLLGSLTAAAEAGAPSMLSCAAPPDLRLLAGSRAVIAVTTGSVKGALALPVEAVAGLTERGTVTVDGDGGPETRTVGLGITDGALVEITDGLAEGELVRIPAPDLKKS